MKQKSLLKLGMMAMVLAAMPDPARAVTLTATTDLINGTAIPTDGGSFLPSGAGPYTYNIDDTPATVTLQTRVDFDMGDFNLNNTGFQNVTINASSITNGTGGTFDFRLSNQTRPSLTIVVTGSLAARSIFSNTGFGNKNGGAVSLTAPDGITLVSGISTYATGNNGGNGGAISLTSTGGAGTGSIQIGGDINSSQTRSGGGSGGAVTLTAANGINLSGKILASSVSKAGGAININGGTGPVSITGSITANGATDGILSITSGDTITLSSQLNLEMINTLTLNAPNVFLNGGVSGAESLTKTGTGIWTLAGTSTYSGATTISAGTLVAVAGGSCSNSAVTVTNSLDSTAALSISVTANDLQWTCASLTFNTNGDGSQLKFAFGVTPSTTMAPLDITGDLTFNGAPLIVVDPANIAPGKTYPLLVVGGTAVPTEVPQLSMPGVSGSLLWGGQDNKTLSLVTPGAGTLISFQ